MFFVHWQLPGQTKGPTPWNDGTLDELTLYLIHRQLERFLLVRRYATHGYSPSCVVITLLHPSADSLKWHALQ